MQIPTDDERRLRIAGDAYNFIESEVRPFLAAGGRLWSKGSQGYPRQLRQRLNGLDAAHQVTFATQDAMRLDRSERVVEHVVPMKRIAIELVDPRQADPRSNTTAEPIAGGPASSSEHLLLIFDQLLVKCWVTAAEHDRLNRAGPSSSGMPLMAMDGSDTDRQVSWHTRSQPPANSLSIRAFRLTSSSRG